MHLSELREHITESMSTTRSTLRAVRAGARPTSALSALTVSIPANDPDTASRLESLTAAAESEGAHARARRLRLLSQTVRGLVTIRGTVPLLAEGWDLWAREVAADGAALPVVEVWNRARVAGNPARRHLLETTLAGALDTAPSVLRRVADARMGLFSDMNPTGLRADRDAALAFLDTTRWPARDVWTWMARRLEVVDIWGQVRPIDALWVASGPEYASALPFRHMDGQLRRLFGRWGWRPLLGAGLVSAAPGLRGIRDAGCDERGLALVRGLDGPQGLAAALTAGFESLASNLVDASRPPEDRTLGDGLVARSLGQLGSLLATRTEFLCDFTQEDVPADVGRMTALGLLIDARLAAARVCVCSVAAETGGGRALVDAARTYLGDALGASVDPVWAAWLADPLGSIARPLGSWSEAHDLAWIAAAQAPESLGDLDWWRNPRAADWLKTWAGAGSFAPSVALVTALRQRTPVDTLRPPWSNLPATDVTPDRRATWWEQALEGRLGE